MGPKPEFSKESKNSVRARKEKFESNNKKDVKTLTKQQGNKNSKSRKNSPNPEVQPEVQAEDNKEEEEEDETDPFKILMKAMTKGFSDVKAKVEENKTSMDILNGRFQMLGKANKESEIKTKKEFDNIRAEIKKSNNELENKITDKVIDKLKPQIEENNRITNENLRRLVQEEISLENFQSKKPQPTIEAEKSKPPK